MVEFKHSDFLLVGTASAIGAGFASSIVGVAPSFSVAAVLAAGAGGIALYGYAKKSLTGRAAAGRHNKRDSKGRFKKK